MGASSAFFYYSTGLPAEQKLCLFPFKKQKPREDISCGFYSAIFFSMRISRLARLRS